MHRGRVPALLLLLLCTYVHTTHEAGEVENVKENEMVTLQWPFNETPYTARYWYRGRYTSIPTHDTDKLFSQWQTDEPQDFTQRQDMTVDRISFSLRIGQTQLGDEGTYSAIGQNQPTPPNIGYVMIATYTVTKVVISKTGKEELGKDISVECAVERLYPTVTADQFKMEWGNSQDVKTDFSELGISGESLAKRYTLSAMRTLRDGDKDVKSITCTIIPPAGFGEKQTASVALDMKYKPNMAPNVNVTKPYPFTRDTVKFTCIYEGLDANPAVSEVKWTKDGVVLSTDPVYTIYNVDVSNSGHYTCQVGNDMGLSAPAKIQITVSPFHSPVGDLVVSTDKDFPMPGAMVNFTCNTSDVLANPELSTVQWSKDGLVIKEWQNMLVTSIGKITTTDTGVYKCAVGNHIGQPLANTITLMVSPFYQPKGAPNLSVNNRDPHEGSTVTFYCNTANIDASPKVDVKWFRDKKSIVGWSSDIVQHEVTAPDSGNDSCAGVNVIGSSEMSNGITLRVQAMDMVKPTPVGLILGISLAIAAVVSIGIIVIGLIIKINRMEVIGRTKINNAAEVPMALETPNSCPPLDHPYDEIPNDRI